LVTGINTHTRQEEKAESMQKVDYNQNAMLEKMRLILAQACGLVPGKTVIVGVSGGPDSLCLLDVLHRFNYPLVVACLDHGLRAEAGGEVKYVVNLARAMGVRVAVKRVDTQAYAREATLSIEEAARHLRYSFLFEQAKEYYAQAIAVGHTADDQAETVLMNLLRGAGLTGLKGMEFRTFLTTWSETVPVVRPLLNTWRSEVNEYCQQYHLTPVFDRSNESPQYFRNQIRLEIIPYLEKYQPHLRRHLVRGARLLALDHALIMAKVDDAWRECLVRQGPGWVELDKVRFLAQETGIQNYILRKAMAIHLPGLPDIDMESVERGREFLLSQSDNKSCDLGGNIRLVIEQKRVWMVAGKARLPMVEWPAIFVDHEVPVAIPGRVQLGEDWMLIIEECADVVSARRDAENNQDPHQTWVDADSISLPLILRKRQIGDRFKPHGMEGSSVSLSDFMINLKLPRRARATWPLVCSGDEIIWVVGCRSSHTCRIQAGTKKVIKLSLVHRSD
jgi:tRNA(Ile)-lysidine synthase